MFDMSIGIGIYPISIWSLAHAIIDTLLEGELITEDGAVIISEDDLFYLAREA